MTTKSEFEHVGVIIDDFRDVGGYSPVIRWDGECHPGVGVDLYAETKVEIEVKVGDLVRIDRYEYGAPEGTIAPVVSVTRSGEIHYTYEGQTFYTGLGACSVAQWVPYGDPALLD